MTFIKKNKKYRTIRARGFTLIELLVTMSVFTMLSTVVIVNYRNVDNSLILRNVVQQVALVVRKAQIEGVSVRGIDRGLGEVFPSYGVSFDTSAAGIPPPNTGFVLYADFPAQSGNNIFDGVCPASLECVQRYSLAKGYTIKELWGNRKSGFPGTSLSRLDVAFMRPNPDAFIIGNASTAFSDAEIVVQSKAGSTKTIVIWKTGQISIE